MKCDVVLGLLIDYVDGLLRPRRAAKVQAHLLRCPRCRDEEAQARHALVALSTLPDLPVPEDALERLETRLAFLPPPAERPRAGRIRAFLLPYAAGLATAAAVLLFVNPFPKVAPPAVEPMAPAPVTAAGGGDLRRGEVPMHLVDDDGLLREVSPEMLRLLRERRILRPAEPETPRVRTAGYEGGDY